MVDLKDLEKFSDADLTKELADRGYFNHVGENKYTFQVPSLLHEEVVLLFKDVYERGNIVELIKVLKNEV